MDNQNLKASKELLKSLNYVVDEKLKQSTKIYEGLVISSDQTGKWNISYNGETHLIKQYGQGAVNVGKKVKVVIPQGNQSLAWFIAENNSSNAIVAEGVSGDWFYRKWVNGFAECWARKQIDNCNIGPWGSMFVYILTGSCLTYPFPFVEAPVIVADIDCVDHVNGWLSTRYEDGIGDRNHTPAYQIVRATTNVDGVSFVMNYYAHGKWK